MHDVLELIGDQRGTDHLRPSHPFPRKRYGQEQLRFQNRRVQRRGKECPNGEQVDGAPTAGARVGGQESGTRQDVLGAHGQEARAQQIGQEEIGIVASEVLGKLGPAASPLRFPQAAKVYGQDQMPLGH